MNPYGDGWSWQYSFLHHPLPVTMKYSFQIKFWSKCFEILRKSGSKSNKPPLYNVFFVSPVGFHTSVSICCSSRINNTLRIKYLLFLCINNSSSFGAILPADSSSIRRLGYHRSATETKINIQWTCRAKGKKGKYQRM